jgi:uncharacterized protein (DUF2336 family)
MIRVATMEAPSLLQELDDAKRNSIAIPVTDELVARGNQKVVSSVAANKGARFSNFGFLHMIKRSESDSILAEQLGLRKDIPRHLFQQLIAKASDDVKKKLARERPDIASQIPRGQPCSQ